MVKGWIKTSLIEYPDHIASVLFFGGCNFRCPMCHNAPLVLNPGEFPSVDKQEVFNFLLEKKGKVNGVVLSGGEPTLYPGLEAMIIDLKNMGLHVKLDTNGYKPNVIEDLLEKNLLDAFSMDIKASPLHYAALCGLESMDMEKINRSIELIRHSGLFYEFRTTVVPGMVDRDDIRAIAEWLHGADRYVLQQFRGISTLDETLGKLNPYPTSLLNEMQAIAREHIKNVLIRGGD